ncbi:MAG: hypothetical protein WEE64_11205 [Dehalococcoidia bacterium]
MILLRNAGLRGLYETRIQKFLQPDQIRWSRPLATGDELSEATGPASMNWGLLLIDADTLALNEEAVASFRQTSPGTLVAVLAGEPDEARLASAGFAVLRHPSGEDAWLRMMNQLLRAAQRQAR